MRVSFVSSEFFDDDLILKGEIVADSTPEFYKLRTYVHGMAFLNGVFKFEVKVSRDTPKELPKPVPSPTVEEAAAADLKAEQARQAAEADRLAAEAEAQAKVLATKPVPPVVVPPAPAEPLIPVPPNVPSPVVVEK